MHLYRNKGNRIFKKDCIFCAWSGNVHRAVKYCPDCGKKLKVPEGPYRVTCGQITLVKEFGVVDFIQNFDGTAMVIKLLKHI